MRDYVVVIPTRNRYESVLRAIRSVQAQTAPPTEIHVVDDASTDRRYQWLEEIVDDARVTLHRRAVSSREEHAAGFAVGAVRNTALREILRVGFDGWIAFLDDDDEWMPEKMARQFEAAFTYDDYRVVCTNALNRDHSGTICGFHHPDHGRQLLGTFWDVTGLVRTLNPVINSTAIVHTDVAEVLGDQWPAGYGEDWDYWRRAAVLSPILRVDEPLAFYTVGNLKEYTL
jgi:glycosyltransferase involved in cell wall biosynthesis